MGSRRGHFDVITDLVGGAGDSIVNSLGSAKGVVDAMSMPMKLGLAGMMLGGVLLLRGDLKI